MFSTKKLDIIFFKFIFILIVILIITSAYSLALNENLNFEKEGFEIAQKHVELLDRAVNDTLLISKINFDNINSAKKKIAKFSQLNKQEIWYNIGNDLSPIEQKKVIPIYKEIVYIDKTGQELIKYQRGRFISDLKDVSNPVNTEFLTETYFADTKNFEQGKVLIGKVMTWYTPKQEIFAGLLAEEFGNYEKVIARDIMKEGVIRFSTPIYKNGDFKGIIVLSLDYRILQELSKHVDPLTKKPVISSTYKGNYLLIFDHEGNTIVHPKPDNIRGYLKNGELAGYNEPNSTTEGNIFNLFKYKKSLSYNEMADVIINNKKIYTSSATDVSGRTKLTLTIPILYSNKNTNYAQTGIFGGIMMSINIIEPQNNLSDFDTEKGNISTILNLNFNNSESSPPFLIYFLFFLILIILVISLLFFGETSVSEKKQIKTFSIRKKLFLSFSILLIVLMFFIFINDYFSSLSNENQDLVYNFNIQLDELTYELAKLNLERVSLIKSSLIEKNLGMVDLEKNKLKHEKLFQDLNNLFLEINNPLNKWLLKNNPEEIILSQYFDRLYVLTSNQYIWELKIIDTLENNNTDLASKLITDKQYNNDVDKYLVILRKLESFEDNLLEKTISSSKNYQKSIVFINYLFLVLIILMGILIAYFVSSSITVPINILSSATKELREGNYKVKVDIKTNDELEELGNAFNDTVKELSHLKEEQKQIDQVKSRFLSITSHELRSPMTPMKAQLQMLLENFFGPLNQKQKESIKIVLSNANHLDRILVDFLEISRMEVARLKFNFVKINLTEKINRLVKEMNSFLVEKKIKVIAEIGKLPTIETDPNRIMQVLRNLINNAIKFSRNGSKVIVKVYSKNKTLFFSVSDQGIGISKKDIHKIFEPFYQVEQTIYRKSGGTGLGLAICRGIVKSQNGHIWAESVIGKGTTMTFTIPHVPVKEIIPIKFLFSSKEVIEIKIKEIFKNYLGPIGINEFEDFKSNHQTELKEIFKYINNLIKSGIISKNDGDKFKYSVGKVFGTKIKLLKNNEKEKRWVDEF